MPEELARLLKEAQKKSALHNRLLQTWQQAQEAARKAEYALQIASKQADEAWIAVRQTGIEIALKEKPLA